MTGFGLMLNRIKWFWNLFPESLLTQTSDWLQNKTKLDSQWYLFKHKVHI